MEGHDVHIRDLRQNQDRLDRLLRDESAKSREELSVNIRHIRDDVTNSLRSLSDSLLSRITELASLQSAHLSTLTQTNEQKLENMRKTIEGRLKYIQDDNTAKLDQMRMVVDEKLHATLEKRLGESFRLVSERLEGVQRGLGEMQVLASGVGDLKKMLTNVKTRGTWGEVQLGNLLKDILTLEQYQKNMVTKKGQPKTPWNLPSGCPAPITRRSTSLLTPNFPPKTMSAFKTPTSRQTFPSLKRPMKAIETRLKLEAKTIRDKYLDPPHTTDYAILYLPHEGLFAEALRRPGLVDHVRREYRVVITGPTTIAALLNSLQMGFRTLAIGKRSSEVWVLLGAVKTDLGRFGDLLEKTHKKLQEASNTIDDAAKKSRTIEKKLKDVQYLPHHETADLLGTAVEQVNTEPLPFQV